MQFIQKDIVDQDKMPKYTLYKDLPLGSTFTLKQKYLGNLSKPMPSDDNTIFLKIYGTSGRLSDVVISLNMRTGSVWDLAMKPGHKCFNVDKFAVTNIEPLD